MVGTCHYVGLSVITNVPIWRRYMLVGEAGRVCGAGGMRELPALLAQFHFKLRRTLKQIVFKGEKVKTPHPLNS